MKTKWGTCSVEARRIWLNLELAKKPVQSDDKFLFLMELNLDPRSAALSGLISGTAAFTNQTLKPESASPVQKPWNVFCKGD
jgi:hypothetical protein